MLNGGRLTVERGRGRRARRAVGLGQDDVPLDPRLHPDPDRAAGSWSTAQEIDAEAARPAAGDPQAVDRLRLPAVQPLPRADRARERRVRAEHQGADAARGARARPSGLLEAVGLADRAALPAARPLGRPEAARGDRPRAGRRRRRAPRRRADREPRLRRWARRSSSIFRDLAKRENRALLIVTHDPKVRDDRRPGGPDPRRPHRGLRK